MTLALLACPAQGRGKAPVEARTTQSLWRFASGTLQVPVERKRGAFSIDYRLPATARQGPRTWYLIKLHLAITFAPDWSDGVAYVSASTNGRAAAQIEFKAGGPKRNRGRRIVLSSVDLIRGGVTRTTNERNIELSYENYLQIRGVRPGSNKLTVTLEQQGDLRVESLTLLADSGIKTSHLRPAKLVLSPILPRGIVKAGDSFRVAFKLRNTGDRSARKVLVAARPSSEDLEVLGSATRRRAGLVGLTSGVFRLRAARSGRFRLVLGAAADNANHPLVEIDVPIARAANQSQASGWGPLRVVTAATLMLVGTALLLSARRRRTRR